MLDKTPEEWRADWDRRQRQQEQRDRIRKVPFPDHPDRGAGWCKWCGDEVIDAKTGARSKRARWHKWCLQDLYLHSRLEYQYAEVERRDGLKCAWPGCGASPERWHWDRSWCHILDHGYATNEYWPARLFRDLPWKDRTEEQRQVGAVCQIERRTALQLDHRVPLWAVVDLPDSERRWYFGPGNLWLLCPAHHKAKTRDEAKIRAKLRSSNTQLHLFATGPE